MKSFSCLGRIPGACWFAVAGLGLALGFVAPRSAAAAGVESGVLGKPGSAVRYVHAPAGDLPGTVVRAFTLGLGPTEMRDGTDRQWLELRATKADGTVFRTWWLIREYPSAARSEAAVQVERFVLREGEGVPVEYRDSERGGAVLPSLVGWANLLPRDAAGEFSVRRVPPEVNWLGHGYRFESGEWRTDTRSFAPPGSVRTIHLAPGRVIGVPSNTRQKDERRRFDGTDYEWVRLGREDYRAMVDAGMNCVRVDGAQLPWVEELDTYYWGVGVGAGPGELRFPECLYRSAYLGPALFLDEPAVGTRDHVIRPRFTKEPEFRKAITPALAFDAFEEHFSAARRDGASAVLARSVAGRKDVDAGTMSLRQVNLFSWETMVDTAVHQLNQDPEVPAAIVFEPPGRFGTRRTVPEWNMSYGCRLATDDPGNLTSVIHGFLRGAARFTGKEWGTSIYGAVDRADAPILLTSAYDQGATRFFFWDNYQLACVPFGECLALSRHLTAHAASQPPRDLARLRAAAEVAILLPRGYGLGHVFTGRGPLWGLPELNLERTNRLGSTYRTVMSAFFSEIERCRKSGVAFDLLAGLTGVRPRGYREVVRVLEDGSVEVVGSGSDGKVMRTAARRPEAPAGEAPGLVVQTGGTQGRLPWKVEAKARVSETSAPVYFTPGADAKGVNHNFLVAWELYGPGAEDYRSLVSPADQPRVHWWNPRSADVDVSFVIGKPGTYRLRAAVGDRSGRTTVAWSTIVAGD